MSAAVNTQEEGQQVHGVKKPRPASRLTIDGEGDQPHAAIYRFPSPKVRCRENVLRFFYPSSVSQLDADPADREKKQKEFERAQQRRDVFLLAFHAVQQLPHTDKWSYYQIAGIHGLPYEPYDDDKGSWNPDGPNKWWGGYCQHGSPLFPTWHRPYVMLLEQSIIRQAKVLAKTLFTAQPTLVETHSSSNDNTLDPPVEAHQLSNANTAEIKRERDAVLKIIDDELCFPYWDWADRSTRLLGVPDVFTSTEISLSYYWKAFTTRTIPNPLKSFVLPKDLGMPYASSDVYNPAAKPLYVVPPEGIPFTPAGYPTVRHVNSAYESQTDKLSLTVIRNAGSTLVEGVYSMFRHTDWLSFSNHYWNEKTHGGGEGYKYGHYSSLELVHDEVHDTVGGIGGQMSYPECGGFDPTFFFHHCNVDRLTALWQFCYPDKWIDDELQLICDGTYTIKPYTPATSNTDLTPFRRSCREGEFVTSNDVRIVDEDCGYTYPELQTARAHGWSPGDMFIHLLDFYKPPEHYVHNWYLVLEGIIKRIFHGIYWIRVFIDKPDATGHTSLSDPHFAGQIFIFARSKIAWCANCESHACMRSNLNITKTMDRLGITIAPETPVQGLQKDAITLVYVNARGNQVYPKDVGWEGPKFFIYYQEGVKDGVDYKEDIDHYREHFRDLPQRDDEGITPAEGYIAPTEDRDIEITPADRATGKLYKF